MKEQEKQEREMKKKNEIRTKNKAKGLKAHKVRGDFKLEQVTKRSPSPRPPMEGKAIATPKLRAAPRISIYNASL